MRSFACHGYRALRSASSTLARKLFLWKPGVRYQMAALPMGFTCSLWACQNIHEVILKDVGLKFDRLLTDASLVTEIDAEGVHGTSLFCQPRPGRPRKCRRNWSTRRGGVGFWCMTGSSVSLALHSLAGILTAKTRQWPSVVIVFGS